MYEKHAVDRAVIAASLPANRCWIFGFAGVCAVIAASLPANLKRLFIYSGRTSADYTQAPDQASI